MNEAFKSQTAPRKKSGAEEVGGDTSRPLPEAIRVLSVVIPVYNEVGTIDELLRRVLAAPYPKQVIVVDDGSTDGTAEALERWEGHPQLVLLQHSRNRGKGAAIRTGLDHAEGRYTIVQDGDLEYDPDDYPAVIEPLLSGEAEVVYGSRYLRPPDGRPRRWSLSRCGVSALNLCARLLYGARLTDEATCYKAFPTAMLRAMDLECERFEFCPEVTAKACRLGVRIREVPIRYSARGRRGGKKIRWTDGLQALGTLWRWRKWRPK
jgi:glycosyltransferase involved in cell wall biosynthesis